MKASILIALPLAAALALPAIAQQSSDQQTPSTQSQAASDSNLGPRQPLHPQTRQGFWGHLNPFARKKYVERQLTPIRDRANELDDVTSANENRLKDVDARATAGINEATAQANEADQHAVDAGNRAQQASQTAQQASSRLQVVSNAVGSIDQYHSAQKVDVVFAPGHTFLTKHAKETLDQVAANLSTQQGYILQVQGYAPGRGQVAIRNSQAMAESVVRYLVLQNQVPLYRIYVVGMGNAPTSMADGKIARVRTGRVQVTLLQNDVASELAQGSTATATNAN